MSVLDDLITDVIDQKPECSDFIVPDTVQNDASQTDSQSAEVSSDSQSQTFVPIFESPGPSSTGLADFNPEIHAVDANGQPKKNQDGSFSKKRGRKSGTIAAVTVDPKAAQKLDCQNAALVTVQLIVGIGCAIGGEEGIASPEEMFSMMKAWTDYYLASGISHLPPWLGVVIATGAYALPRSRKPKTREKLAVMWGTILPGVKKVISWVRFW